jgi:hypothetical protein
MNARFIAGMAVLLATQWHAGSSGAAETMVRLKPDRQIQGQMLRSRPPTSDGSKQKAKLLSRETVNAAVDARIRSMFDRAVDPSTGRVTNASAEKAGVGYFTGQFEEIDHDNDGSITFSEVTGFLDAQSPIARPASVGSVQIIE